MTQGIALAPGRTVDRRTFLSTAAGGALAGAWSAAPGPSRMGSRFNAVAFDGFPIFDPGKVSTTAESLFPGRGMELVERWRARHFEYQWIRALSDRYVDFERTAEDALVFAGRAIDLDMARPNRDRLMDAYRTLDVWPDVGESLLALRHAGVRLALLSNMTPNMLRDGLARAGLDDAFEHVLSTHAVRTYKPDPRAYRLAVDAWGMEREQILFAAFAAWDVAGARWFGYPTFWVNRAGAPSEELGVHPDASGRGLEDLVRFVGAQPADTL